jgi:hypothetical protein
MWIGATMHLTILPGNFSFVPILDMPQTQSNGMHFVLLQCYNMTSKADENNK